MPRVASLASVKEAKAAAGIPPDIMHGTPSDSVGLDSWRPNIFIFSPQDYWRGSVDYVPWKLGDNGDKSRVAVKERGHCILKALQKGSEPTGAEGLELEAGSGMTGRKKGDGARASVQVAPGNPSSNAVLTRVDTMERSCRVEGADISGQAELELGVGANQSGVVVSEDGGGVGSMRYASDRSTGLKAGEVETALHSVLDALRNVREERLRTRFTRTPSKTGG